MPESLEIDESKVDDQSAYPVTVKLRYLTEEEAARNKAVMLENENDLMFMAPFVEGYALKNKMWCKFRPCLPRRTSANRIAFSHVHA